MSKCCYNNTIQGNAKTRGGTNLVVSRTSQTAIFLLYSDGKKEGLVH